MSKIAFTCGPAPARREGGTLVCEISLRPDGKKPKPRTWQPGLFDDALNDWFAAASDGESVEVLADVDSDGTVTAVRMARPPVVIRPKPDSRRLEETARRGGSANPYTFIPALPRAGLPDGLGDQPPEPHGVITTDDHWSGWLALRVTTRTPLLLPDPEHVTRGADKHPTYPVRVGPDGKPLLHGASVKGALRSAYEAITASRYGVFRGHDRPLGYRRPASREGRPAVTPARVEADGDGGLEFRICTAISVPLYDRPGDQTGRRKATAIGTARQVITAPGGAVDWGRLHGTAVSCTIRRIVPRRDRGRGGRPGREREVVDQVALDDDERSLTGAGPRKHGWLAVTGRSIATKASERLFVPVSSRTPVPVADAHHQMWHTVLASYHEVALQQAARGEEHADLQRSRHIIADRDGAVPERLREGDLVYLEFAERSDTVTAILPVAIGRLPYSSAPADLLDASLHPAADPERMSPADRLFGWAPARSASGRARASGYRGRVRVADVTCLTDDWRTDFPDPGVKLAPLSTPEPTQFRFYGASDSRGSRMESGVSKDQGYRQGSGLRGRKAYWYPNAVPGEYWQPGTDQPGGVSREWQAPQGAAPSQTSSHLGWVRIGTEFTIRLFLDAVPSAEVGPLVWLLSQDGSPIRLGGGKPLGFGAVGVSIDWEATELRTGSALRGSWLRLTRPSASDSAAVKALADDFEQQAKTSPVLAPALEAFQKIARGLDRPAAYPRTQRQPQAETYRWFVANERIKDRHPIYGLALPHVLEDNQDLPYLPEGDD